MSEGSVFHGVVDLGASGMFQRPFVKFLVPRMIICPFLNMLRLYLLNMATQSSSHNCPIEMRDPDLMSLKMCPVFAALESSGAKGMMAFCVGLIMWPLATLTRGPFDVLWILVQLGRAVVSR